MDTLISVLEELWQFVFVEWFGFRDQNNTRQPTLSLVSPYFWQQGATTGVRSTNQSSPDSVDSQLASVVLTATVIVPESNLFIAPAITFDGVVAKLPYGTVLAVENNIHRWYAVTHQQLSGWVLRDEVSFDNIQPQFKLGVFYEAEDENTDKLRSLIADEFAGAIGQMPLSDVEYVTYRLKKKGRLITWSNERPRLSGKWQQLLRGQFGIHIGVLPKTDAVMEIVFEDGTGHLAYVEAVFPDQSILISEFGFPETGQYSERTLTKEEWREFRPVFIEVA